MKILSKNKNFLLLALIFLLACLVRIPQILAGQFQFVFDMGRDMIWTRDIVILKKPYLIGPWGSIPGVFFGPLWYYFLSIPFALTGGSPTACVLFVCFINLIVVFLGYQFGKQIKKGVRGKRLGLLIAFFLAFSPASVSTSTFAFHANLLPFTTLLFIYSLFKLKTKHKDSFYLPLAGFLASINFHLEPATAIFTTLTLIIFLFLNLKLLKKLKILFLTALAFIIPFIPQTIFELRHNFLQTKSLISYLKGENPYLKGGLTLLPRINNRLIKFFDLFKYSVFSSNILGASLTLLVTAIGLFIILRSKQKNQKIIIEVSLLTIVVPLLGYTFLFTPELKGWYLTGISVVFCLLVALVFNLLLEKYQKLKIITFLILFLIFVANTAPFSRLKDVFSGFPEGNAGTLQNQNQVIDWIYQDAGGEDFSVYIYTPPIYDFHYQYLFWWYGKKTYHYEPYEYSYLPGKKDYIKYKDNYYPPDYHHKKPPHLFYLIIEQDSEKKRVLGWLGHFSESKTLKKVTLPGQIVVEKRLKNGE